MPWYRPATDTPFGFRPDDEPLRCSRYLKDASAAAIYPGDVVILEADGGLAVASTGSVNIVGAAQAYHAASTLNNNFMVFDHPDQRFIAQDDGDTGIMTATSVGARANITVTTGDTTTLQSLHEIDSSTAFTTASLALSILALHPLENLSFATTTGQQRKWVVGINNHLWSGYQQVGI
jgi:hypothetical protein